MTYGPEIRSKGQNLTAEETSKGVIKDSLARNVFIWSHMVISMVEVTSKKLMRTYSKIAFDDFWARNTFKRSKFNC